MSGCENQTEGAVIDGFSTAMGQEIGFEVQAYDTQPDAIQAVLSGRAYATLGGNTVRVYRQTERSVLSCTPNCKQHSQQGEVAAGN